MSEKIVFRDDDYCSAFILKTHLYLKFENSGEMMEYKIPIHEIDKLHWSNSTYRGWGFGMNWQSGSFYADSDDGVVPFLGKHEINELIDTLVFTFNLPEPIKMKTSYEHRVYAFDFHPENYTEEQIRDDWRIRSVDIKNNRA